MVQIHESVDAAKQQQNVQSDQDEAVNESLKKNQA